MLSINHYKIQLCASKISYEFIPRNEQKINVQLLGKELEKQNNSMKIKIITPFLLALSIQNHKVNVFPTGKIIIDDMQSEKEAEKIFLELIKRVNACPSMMVLKA